MLEATARRYGFDLAEALAAGVPVPSRPGRSGWADRWCLAARSAIETQRAAAQQREREAVEHEREIARKDAEEAKQSESSWHVEPQFGTHSFAGDLYGFRSAYRPGRPGGRCWTDVEAECKSLRLQHAREIQRNVECFYAILNG